ncbi:MAG TPA: hypothetical protein VHN38_07480 [Immundisolibacter sp.]|nr:hypothetical protein [Immundisolibacter sp.]
MADLRNVIPQNKQQSSRRVEWTVRYSFAQYSLAASGQNTIFTLPKGYVHERCDPVGRVPEGAAGTFDLGIAGDLDGFVDGGNANGTANAKIALAGTESLTPGTYFHTDTPVIINIAAGQPTLDAAVLDLTFVGYMTDTV